MLKRQCGSTARCTCMLHLHQAGHMQLSCAAICFSTHYCAFFVFIQVLKNAVFAVITRNQRRLPPMLNSNIVIGSSAASGEIASTAACELHNVLMPRQNLTKDNLHHQQTCALISYICCTVAEGYKFVQPMSHSQESSGCKPSCLQRQTNRALHINQSSEVMQDSVTTEHGLPQGCSSSVEHAAALRQSVSTQSR